MLMRFWLELNRHGLYLQPFGSVITNAKAHAELIERLGAEEGHATIWLLLRLGHAAAPPRSLRLSPREVLV
jgi:hypothetical protein